MSRILGALDAIASLTDSPRRRRVLREQVQRISELADRTIDSAHDRARIERRLMHVREAIEAGPALCAEEAKA